MFVTQPPVVAFFQNKQIVKLGDTEQQSLWALQPSMELYPRVRHARQVQDTLRRESGERIEHGIWKAIAGRLMDRNYFKYRNNLIDSKNNEEYV